MTTQKKVISYPKQKATEIILCILLLVRFLDGLLIINFLGDYQLLYSKLYISITFAVLAFVIWLNKDGISNLNIDHFFILLFITSGILALLWFWVSVFGLIVGVSVIFTVVLVETKQLIVKVQEKPSILLGTALGVLPIIVFRLLFNETSIFTRGFSEIMENGQILWIVISRLWGVVFEEMLFRGMLWAFLRHKNFSEGKILLIQALLFWICHLNLVSRASFWFTLPFLSLWFGFLVRRYKSLTPSTITHFVYNFIADLMKAAA